jgi:hypothetical protein
MTSITPVMEIAKKPKWEIDKTLESLRGQQVRVAAEAFAPSVADGRMPVRLIAARELILPDNSRTDRIPVYFEGRLQQFQRRIGVVQVRLGPPDCPADSADGIVAFRGRTAVILRGPAIVTLAFPFHIERVPLGDKNYWLDLKMPRAQFLLPFDD